MLSRTLALRGLAALVHQTRASAPGLEGEASKCLAACGASASRVFLSGSGSSRGYAAESGDFVLDFLKEDLAAYETYLEECRKVYYPLGESDNKDKVAKFAAELEAAKKKAKVPTTTERQKQLLGFFKWQAGDSVREFYNLATPLMSPENASAWQR